MTLIENVKKTFDEVIEAVKYAEKQLLNAPDGFLSVKNKKGNSQYYQRNKGETTGHYLGKKCIKQIRQLEEKYYYSELLETARNEEQELQKIYEKLENMTDYKSVFLNIPFEKRHLISPYEQKPQNDDEIIRLFNKKHVSEELKLVTQNGECVRSKSELIIADRLKAADIPYFYEDPLIMAEDQKENETMKECLYWHPDFRVQNRRTGKQYYWEHFGMLDNPEYCKSCQEKLEIYAQYGYFAGDNLIITSESSQHGINTKYVDCLIEKYLK